MAYKTILVHIDAADRSLARVEITIRVARHFDAHLIVMGAYGHSRFRELVMGGASRTIIDSMTVPVLLSH